MNPKYRYRVDIWERERGWGAKIEEVKFFDTPEEAEEFVNKFNERNCQSGPVPDWYMNAEGPHKVMVDA
jgi:hypothetical protein